MTQQDKIVCAVQSIVVATTAAFCMGSSCETDIVEDPGFQFWCGESLCEWETLDGEIRRVSTWHAADYAVELVGPSVALEQGFDDRCDGADRFGCFVFADCLRVELISDVDVGVDVTLEIDFDGDGNIDWTEVVEEEGFKRQGWDVFVNGSSGSTSEDISDGRIALRKSGDGYAAVAQLRVSEECGDTRAF